jgi:hypothetical protein
MTGPSARSANVVKVGEAKKVCFVVSPIGDRDSLEQMHADWLVSEIIEPVIRELPGFTVKRADHHRRASPIDTQVMHYLLNSELVIADLSSMDPYVFYDIAIRHIARKPIIHMHREGETLPFDPSLCESIGFSRLKPSDLRTARSHLRQVVNAVLEEGYEVVNPISHFFGRAQVTPIAAGFGHKAGGRSQFPIIQQPNPAGDGQQPSMPGHASVSPEQTVHDAPTAQEAPATAETPVSHEDHEAPVHHEAPAANEAARQQHSEAEHAIDSVRQTSQQSELHRVQPAAPRVWEMTPQAEATDLSAEPSPTPAAEIPPATDALSAVEMYQPALLPKDSPPVSTALVDFTVAIKANVERTAGPPLRPSATVPAHSVATSPQMPRAPDFKLSDLPTSGRMRPGSADSPALRLRAKSGTSHTDIANREASLETADTIGVKPIKLSSEGLEAIKARLEARLEEMQSWQEGDPS